MEPGPDHPRHRCPATHRWQSTPTEYLCRQRHRPHSRRSAEWLPPLFWPRPSSPGLPALRAAPLDEALRDQPYDGRGPPARPRWTMSDSSRPSQGIGTGQAPLCWSARAHEPARRRGSSSATSVTALHSRRMRRYAHTTPILAHRNARASEPYPGAGPDPSFRAIRTFSICTVLTGPRRARSNDLRLTARSTQSEEVRHNHAPRPGTDRPTSRDPSESRTTRTISSTTSVRRQPRQVRMGAMPRPRRLELRRPWLELRRPWLELRRPWLELRRRWLELRRPWLELRRPWLELRRPWLELR